MSILVTDKKFLETSGRYDLTSEDRIFFLNLAQRSLDSKVFGEASDKRFVGQLAAGDDILSIPNLMSLKDVWLHGQGSSGGTIKVQILTNLTEYRDNVNWFDLTTEIQSMANVPNVSPVYGSRITCISMPDKPALAYSDTTVVTRVNLTNAALSVATSPKAPTELSILIEDGLLSPLSPALGITVGTVTITGTDRDGAALVEVVDCSKGAGFYKTTGLFKTVTNVDTASFNRLVTGDEKITIKTGRKSFLEDLDLTEAWNGKTLRFFPTLDEVMAVEIIGNFGSIPFAHPATDGQKTFWTERYPMLLVWKAMQILEPGLRNREGYLDFDLAINAVLFDINRDRVVSVEDTQEPTMEG